MTILKAAAIFSYAPRFIQHRLPYPAKISDRSRLYLTDVGSVKTSIHEEIISLGMEENFIGGHPMAGSEKNGFANSKAHLIENAYYILTPSAKVSEEKSMLTGTLFLL